MIRHFPILPSPRILRCSNLSKGRSAPSLMPGAPVEFPSKKCHAPLENCNCQPRYIYDSKKNVTQNLAAACLIAFTCGTHQTYTRDISRHKTGDISC